MHLFKIQGAYKCDVPVSGPLCPSCSVSYRLFAPWFCVCCESLTCQLSLPRHSSNLKKEEDVFTQALTFMSHTSSCYWGACVGSCSLEISIQAAAPVERRGRWSPCTALRTDANVICFCFALLLLFCNAGSVQVLSAGGCRGRLISVTCNFGVLLLICISLFLMFIPFQISRTICLEG